MRTGSTKVINAWIIKTLAEPHGSELICDDIAKGKLDVNARAITFIGRANGAGILYYAVMQIKSREPFERFVATYIRCGGDINLLCDQGFTALDAPVPDMDTPRGVVLHWKKQILKKYGAKKGREISTRQAEIAAKPIIPGCTPNLFPNSHLSHPTYGFTFESKSLVSVNQFLRSPVVNTSNYMTSVSVKKILSENMRSIGGLYASGELLSTCFLVSERFIMTARHSVNRCKMSRLSVGFFDGQSVQAPVISGLIESGADFGLDYIILELAEPIVGIKPMSLTRDNMSSSLMFLGIYLKIGPVFSTFKNENMGGLRTVSFQQTGASLSGSPYLSLDGRVTALHSCASTGSKSGLYISTIIDYNQGSIVAALARGEPVDDVVSFEHDGIFQKFTGAVEELGEFDEGRLAFKVDDSSGKPIVSYEGRHSNQNSKTNRKKIKKRLMRLPSNALTTVQKKYCDLTASDSLDDAGIHIAHNISAQSMCDGLIYLINNPTIPDAVSDAVEVEAFQNLADEMASSDDEEVSVRRGGQLKKTLPRLVRRIRATQRKVGYDKQDAEKLATEVGKVLRTMNRKTKNLMPGDGPTNSSIGGHRDPHLYKTRAGRFKETAQSKRLHEKARICFGARLIKAKKAPNGQIQSSSVHCDADPTTAYYAP